MFLYLIMLNLLKEMFALHAIQRWMNICVERRDMFGPIFLKQFGDKWHVWFVGLCADGSANNSSQVLHVAYLPISGSYFSRCLFLKGIFEYFIPLWLLLAHCNYSWHGTTPGPQRSRAESRRLLLARDHSWTVTPECHAVQCHDVI